MERVDIGRGKGVWAFVGGALLFVLILLYLGHRQFAAQYHEEVAHRLVETARLLAVQVAMWREMRLADASLIVEEGEGTELGRRLLSHPGDKRTKDRLGRLLARFVENRGLRGIGLYDPKGHAVVTTGAAEAAISAFLQPFFTAALGEGRPAISNFFSLPPNGHPGLVIVAPLFDAGRRRPRGAFVLWIDPRDRPATLFEMARFGRHVRSPFLVFREADQAVALSLTHDDTLRIRHFPLDRREMAVVRAVLGEVGVVRGSGTWGGEVIAGIHPVPDTPWVLVLQTDKEDLETPLRAWGRLVVLLGFTLLLGAGLAFGMFHWRGRARIAQQLAESRAAFGMLSARHEALLHAVPEIVAIVDNHKVYTWLNAAGIAFFGEEAIGREASAYFVGPQDTYTTVSPVFEGVEEVVYVESWQRRKDGEKRLLAWWCRTLKDESGRVIGALSTARDITEIRERQIRLETLNRVYAVLSEINQMIVRAENKETLFREVCRIMVETGGYVLAWIGLLDSEASVIRPVSHAGREEGYLSEIRIPLEDLPNRPGPTSTAFRTGRPVVVEDIATDPRMDPWRDAALQRGYRAMASFPLIVFGQCKGVLNLYAGTPDLWGPEERTLLEKVAGDIAYAVEFIEKEKRRQEAEAALKASEAWFRRLADVTHTGIIIYQGERVVFTNAAVTQISGYSMEEIRQRPFWEFVHPEDQELVKTRGLARQRGEAVPSQYVFRILTRDGRTVWVDFTAGRIDWEGAPAGMGTLYDITALKEAEAALKKKNEDLATLVDIGTLLLESRDVETLLQQVVEEGTLLFGLERGMAYLLEGETLRLVVSTPRPASDFPDDFRMVPVAAHPRAGEALRTRRPVFLSDASLAELTPAEAEWARTQGVRSLFSLPLFKEDRLFGLLIFGSVERVHAFTEEVIDLGRVFATQVALAMESLRLLEEARRYAAELETSLHHLEVTRAALAESEARFRRLAENAEDLIYRYEFIPKRGFTYVSPSATAMTGYTPEDHYADPDLGFKIVHPDDRPLLQAVSQGGIEKGQPIVLRWVKKDGTVFWTEQRNVPIYDEAGNLIAIEGIARDITERKRAEEQIQRALKEQEILLKEIHHRVKNNLTVIASLLNLQATRVKTPEEAFAAFAESRDRVYAMALIHEKIYHQTGLYSEIDMRRYLEDLVRQLSTFYDPQRRIRVRLVVAEEKIDLTRAVPCALILNELVTNALKHAFPEGREGNLRIRFSLDGEKHRYRLVVSDDGIGLPPRFDPVRDGSFGLYLIDLLTKQLRGTWSVGGRKGATFRVVFPA